MTPPTVWLVVSDLFFLSKLRTSLVAQGCTVKVTPNPEDLLKASLAGNDLIILDLGLPGMPPAEIIRKLRESGPKDIPVLAFTNHARIPLMTETINDANTKVVSNSFVSDNISNVVGLISKFTV